MATTPEIKLIDFSDPENDNRSIENVDMSIIWTEEEITGIHSATYTSVQDIDYLIHSLIEYRNKVSEQYSVHMGTIYIHHG